VTSKPKIETPAIDPLMAEFLRALENARLAVEAGTGSFSVVEGYLEEARAQAHLVYAKRLQG
jgi:hypothetical protein